MNFRTDLALEIRESLSAHESDGVEFSEEKKGNVVITRIRLTNEAAAESFGKPLGTYITVEVPPLGSNAELFDGKLPLLSKEIASLLPTEGTALIAGLGNPDITPDALGPRAGSYIFATRHINGELAKSTGLQGLRPIAAFSPGVMGQTGMETREVIQGIAANMKPAVVIVIDALAARSLDRLGRTVQISDSGISPGSGVGNMREEISESTIGVPVIAVGVPTVVDAATLAYDIACSAGITDAETLYEAALPVGGKITVTPREVDLMIERGARLVAMGINCALLPQLEPEDILALVS